jgi:hypothetical protein
LGIFLSFSRKPAARLKGAKFYSTPPPIANKSGPFGRKNTPFLGVFFPLLFSVLQAPQARPGR